MQRTRHSSLDYLGSNLPLSPHEEWSEFLSASMVALTTDDEEPTKPTQSTLHPPPQQQRRAMSPLHSLQPTLTKPRALTVDTFDLENYSTHSHGNHTGVTNGDELMNMKVRGGSLSESLTSSTGSSPSGATWRPLGRRLTPPQQQQQPPPMSNQLDHLFDLQSGSSVFLDASNNNGDSTTKTPSKLKHVSSFREVVNSCLSSSGSSLYDSSSSDEEPQEINDESTLMMGIESRSTPVDPAYAEQCLPVLASLPNRVPRSISTDSTGRLSSLSLVKSPVLGTRKDSQTWQLQDEEFLGSPRFEALRSPNGDSIDMFGGNANLFSGESNNQFHDELESHSRYAKEIRASSVDFTYGRSPDVNPPLPPPQEPLQRLRAKSFSFSSAYSSTGFNPVTFNKQPQYAPHHQTLQQDYANSHGMRSFAGGSIHPPSNPPPSAGVRPPRVSIPTDSPMHPYHQQFAPPPPYRRYSTDNFAMAPYPETFHNNDQDNQARHTNASRLNRSYSMEYTPSRQIRSQSMEGQQLFAAAPPLEYPPLNRSTSGGVSYDWPRSPMGMVQAPPLPPDTRSSSLGKFPSLPPEAYYEVEFKRGRQEIFAGSASYNPGDYVKVEADRGEDIGRIVQRATDLAKLQAPSSNDPAATVEDGLTRGKRHELPNKKIICVASQRECEMLSEQRKEEHEVFEVCKSKVRQRLLPMNVIDAEYQFDRHKLTFFFEADRRIDFRELVRDLFAIYKTRIWLQQVVPTGKKITVDYDETRESGN